MKQIKIQIIFYFFTMSLIWVSCAQYRPPSGGSLDVTPPKLDTLQSSPLFRTNFTKSTITLIFDEWLKMGNAQQVLVSPPLEFSPRVSTRGKSVVFEFNEKEVLKENTTYVINFGEYISDLNEGNVVSDMLYVFSTGNIIDSLSLSAKIVSEGEEKVPQGAILMVYNTSRDSNIIDKIPLYAAFADKTGHAKISYMAPGTYYVYALMDKNANYKFDGGEELVGFMKDSIEVLDQVTLPVIHLFKEDPAIAKPIASKKSKGTQELTYNQNPGKIEIGPIPENVRFAYKQEKEKVIIYHYADPVSDWNLIISNAFGKSDTFKIKSDTLKAGFEGGKVIPLKYQDNMVNEAFRAERITFPFPVYQINPSLIELEIKKDSTFIKVATPVNFYLEPSGWELQLEHTWIGDTIYRLSFLPEALESIWATKNTDTLKSEFRRGIVSDFGNIDIVLEEMDSTSLYLYELLLGEKIISKGEIIGDASRRLNFNRLRPGAYSLKLVLDTNRNGRADGGKVLYKRRAEPVIIRNLDELRADWDLELKINVSDAINGKI